MRRMPFILIPLMCDHVAFSSSETSQYSVIDPSQQLSSVADCRETVARLGQDLTLDELLSELVSLNPAATRFVLSLKDRYKAVQRAYLDGEPSLLGGKPVSKWTDAEIIVGIETMQTKKAFAIESIIAIIQRAVVLTYGYEARLPQILSTISILDSKDSGRLLQIATGEGKTLTTAMIAAAKALQGHKVDVISSSPVLAVRDGKSIQSFLTKLGLMVGINQEDDTSSDDKQDDGSQRTKESSKQDKVKLYNHPIVYGSIGQFQGDYLRTVYLDEAGRGDRPFDTVLVDEVDSSMIDEIHHMTMLSGHQAGMEFLQVILTAIWNKVVELNQRVVYIPSKGYYVYVEGDFSIKDGDLYLHTTKGVLEQAVHFIHDAHTFKRNFLLTFTSEILRSATFKVPAHLSSFINDHIAEWATSALWASYHQENVTYVCGSSLDGTKSIMPVDVQNIITPINQTNGQRSGLNLK